MADVTRDPRAYELMAVFVPELSDEELVEQIERVTGYITDQSGTITEILRESPWGRRRLAYTVRFNSVDYRDAVYVVYHFDNVPSSVINIERELKLDVRVMRYLLVHDDPLAGEKDHGQHAEAEAAATAEAGETPAPEDALVSTDEPAPVAATDDPAPVAEAAPAAQETTVETEAVPEEPTAAETEAAPVEPEVAPAADAEAETAPSVTDVAAPADESTSTDEEKKED